MPNSRLKPRFTSIGGDLRQNFSNFLSGCRDVAVEHWPFHKVNEQGAGEWSTGNAPALEAPATENTEIKETAGIAAQDSQLPDEEFCSMLNQRIEMLRQQKGFEDLEDYLNETSYYRRDCFTLVQAKVQHNRWQALRYVTRMEYFAKMYRAYVKDFLELKSQVDEIECLLFTDNAFYAEIEAPQDEAFTPDDEVTQILQFSYSPQGVAAAKKWIKAIRDVYYDSKDKLGRKPASAKR